jgi:predicted nucleic-acid-binding Zn-ribbon protein
MLGVRVPSGAFLMTIISGSFNNMLNPYLGLSGLGNPRRQQFQNVYLQQILGMQMPPREQYLDPTSIEYQTHERNKLNDKYQRLLSITKKLLKDRNRRAAGKSPNYYKCPACGNDKFEAHYSLIFSGFGMLWWRKWFGKVQRTEGLAICCNGCKYIEITPLGFLVVERREQLRYDDIVESVITGKLIQVV